MATRATQFRTVTPALVEQRATTRHLILLTRTKVSGRDKSPVEAMLHDLSVYGCRLACQATHTVGEKIWLRLRADQPVSATVAWNDGEYLGCRFDAPIDRSLMRALTLVIC
ncbi:PilZ domain-containing protein [Sphingomonas sp. AOB5]|uniref:PilZ domain-containing protein n=1 Tax=Sphingomonas sp. AOB5 TaxID=3034017 RepID=UPI0023F7C8CE|nr:PilZ domain-containing protein [Sphingomonas sp. AOB5]MDF7775002.1 PilZ domain-containing protein [Sphingomonas sp. AOB5]